MNDTTVVPDARADVPELDGDPVGPVTLPGRVRSGMRTMALAGFVVSGLWGAAVIAPPITTISSAIY